MKLIWGDCIEELKLLEENSVDAVITDPPYGLSFMGKKWDYDVPSVDIWKECLRVLRPGGYLLSFAGTRTQHRMAINIEDAGFEIRDMIAWVYGCLSEDTEILTINGWERYHKDLVLNPVLCYNVDKNSFEFHKPLKDFIYENKYTAYRIKSDKTDQIVSRNHRVLVERGGRKVFVQAETLERQEDIPFLESLQDLPEAIYDFHKGTSIKKHDLLTRVQEQDIANKKKTTNNTFEKSDLPSLWQRISDKKKQTIKILFSKVQRKSEGERVEEARSQGQSELETRKRIGTKRKNDRRDKSLLEGRSNLFQETRELLADKICEMSQRVFGNGSQGWLCYGTQTDNGSIAGQVSNQNGSSPSYQSQPTGQSDRKSDVISNKQSPQITRGTITPIKYKGKVWCVEVPTGAFVARRKGQVFITGNSGFPKSLNIGKAVDKLQGNEREVVGTQKLGGTAATLKGSANRENWYDQGKGGVFTPEINITKGTSEWEGWGTALKPALEPITVARKPLSEKTVAENVLKWGTGGLNIDGSRVEVDDSEKIKQEGHIRKGNVVGDNRTSVAAGQFGDGAFVAGTDLTNGRFPANLIHDGSDEVVGLFPESKSIQSMRGLQHSGRHGGLADIGGNIKSGTNSLRGHNDSGSASRFFYCAKASKKERNIGCDKNCHPTVKPLALMEYLIKLVSRKNAVILDPFMGSGTTGMACKKLGRKFIGIEKEYEYFEIAKARIEAIKVENNLFD